MVTGSGWVAVGCWMSFTGGVLKNELGELKGREKEEGEDGREERRLCGERYSGCVFTETVPKEISTHALSSKS